METEKLYYSDCHMREFSAVVLNCKDSGGIFKIELDRTAFYPEGGGQASDTGILLAEGCG